MLKQAVRSFFTLRPVRVKTTTTATAVWLSIGILFTQVADALSTKLGLNLGAVEANGLMATLILEHGIYKFIAFKMLAALFLIWAFWKRPTAAAFVIFMYIAVVVNNLIVMLRLV
jgi:hypothetical protein